MGDWHIVISLAEVWAVVWPLGLCCLAACCLVVFRPAFVLLLLGVCGAGFLIYGLATGHISIVLGA